MPIMRMKINPGFSEQIDTLGHCKINTMAFPFLTTDRLSVILNGKKILSDISLNVGNNEHWAITGPSGSGKTTLIHTLAGRHFFSGQLHFGTAAVKPKIVVVDQQHRFKNLSNTSDFYYQQRYNSSDAEDALTVAGTLALENFPAILSSGIQTKQLPELVHIEALLHKPLIQLSNGENKRLQIAKAILQQPDLLILDNPFTGLDVEGRQSLNTIFATLAASGIQLLLVTAPSEIPPVITHVAVLEAGRLTGTHTASEFAKAATPTHSLFKINKKQLQDLKQTGYHHFEYAIKMIDVNVRYADKHVLKNINWQVKRGEHWAVSGPNGAGKSTLLSLVTGDNAKAYANQIYLFDKRRGTGESIWDIKKKIGYVSPEMHLYFDFNATCFETIASGLFDSIGLFRKLTEEQKEMVGKWMELLHLQDVGNKRLSSLSTGQQRYILLARALVKNPPLLILDEPCQGLDAEHVEQFKEVVNEICLLFDTTLLYVSHYKHEIPECVTRFLQIENGEATEK